ncbi:hypothetical protein JQ617_38320 [Bradyrhizobium sp. KB893862 SZCCT0404]|uniref:hypothetical protein n=1 Tax=Bradyrhizobium sp. KB893862 SZCCT0404 TaxID=2807672 RepID=UPI001BAB1C38|nr:hypothetical protein [Bradyrhizobium sp. KB893862 SZCCT0404]MBR1179876.1 hypothetical protein [Bradyrhizobium sp. KB893862 SZCCT0404]
MASLPSANVGGTSTTSGWDIPPTPEVRSPRLAPEQHWTDIVRGMVREAPLPSLMVAFLVGVLVSRR